ncbi:MAG TPA: hypothetical protein VJT49_08275 [Amycolatopsis sp.]|uniref:hypothetical protein n=1 Tax=Amycolatopsis sp. TaxID=37632 RepID=UPI002B49A352|nr:hypothetical protein [Amycolatopsis sp.]HKS45096.1 hypothetical protein [Amycolatopsis sp.]
MVEKEGAGEKRAFKPGQVIASALAAVTAAFLGSTLGVEGTVAGAGIASVVTTIGSEVYLRSLRRTRDAARRTKEVLALTDTRLRQETRLVEPPPKSPANPLMRPNGPVPPPNGPTGHPRPPVDPRNAAVDPNAPTVHLPRPTQALPALGGGLPNADAPTVLVPGEAIGPAPKPTRPWWKSRWTLAAGMSVVAFVVGMLVITGFETVTGHAVSGGTGTTISRLGNGGASKDKPTTPVHPTTTETRTNTVTPSSRTGRPSSSAPVTPTEDSAESSAPSSSSSAPPSSASSPTSG